MEGHGAVRLAAQGRRERRAGRRRKRVLEIIMATHAGMTTEEFEADRERLDHDRETSQDQTALHRDGLSADARAAGLPARQRFQDLHRLRRRHRVHAPWTEAVYGIPPEQVSAAASRRKFEMRDGKPVLVRLPEIDFIDDKAGKPVGIHKFIGRRPIAAFGNSDGDLQMLQWTTAGRARASACIVHHDDGDREWAYDRDSPCRQLDAASTKRPNAAGRWSA